MFFNVVCALIVGLFGSPVRIYIFSNVGYIVAVARSLYGYFLMRQFRPEQVSPFRLPGFFRWVALACALFLTFDYFVGGWNSPDIVVGPGQGHFLYILGPGDRGRLRPALLVAQDERQAARDRRDWAPCPWWSGHRAASTSTTSRARPWSPEGLPTCRPGSEHGAVTMAPP